MSITILIILVTVVTSIQGFNRPDFVYKYRFNAYAVSHKKQWYRIFSSGFLHADWVHLGFNMLALYSFGRIIEEVFKEIFGEKMGMVNYALLYVGGLAFSSLYSLAKHKNNSYYNALGASGAVSAVIFTSILIDPGGMMRIYFIPMNSLVFGIVFLAFSYYMGKKNIDNIGHDAHFWGAIFGFIFPLFLQPLLWGHFLHEIQKIF